MCLCVLLNHVSIINCFHKEGYHKETKLSAVLTVLTVLTGLLLSDDLVNKSSAHLWTLTSPRCFAPPYPLLPTSYTLLPLMPSPWVKQVNITYRGLSVHQPSHFYVFCSTHPNPHPLMPFPWKRQVTVECHSFNVYS